MKTRLVCLMLAMSFNSYAETCQTAHYRAFDFWLGKWQVTTATDDIIRVNDISLINDGCALLEQYSTPDGYQGKSLNIYDKTTQQWHQTWVDNSGALLQLSGQVVNGSMVMTGITINNGKKVLNRITWTPLPEDKVRQHWQIKSEKDDKWQTAFDGLYSKVGS